LKIAIIGAGAIGCLFGVRLLKSGQSVLLVHHDRKVVNVIRRRGAVLKELAGNSVRAQIRVKQSLSDGDHPDLVLLTVKAYDTEGAVRSLNHQLSPNTPILSLQNGLGNIETLSRHLPESQILAGTTTEAALLTAPGRISHTGSGVTWIGGRAKQMKLYKSIRTAFVLAGFRTEVRDDIIGAIWSKAIVNSAINPISALTGVSNENVLRISHLRQVSLKLVAEGTQVATAKGIKLAPSPTRLLSRVLNSSGKNRSSMLQDIEAGKKTEILQLNGWIASIGKKVGVRTPYNQMLTQLVLGLEAITKTG
jgi:2-dehydropantoate 2-reductase